MFTSLQPREQKTIQEAAAIASAQQWKMAAAEDAAALAKLQTEKGMQFDPLPPETRAALRRTTSAVVDDARKRVGDELVDGILAAAKDGAHEGH